MSELANLYDEEFTSELRASLFNDDLFRDFLETDVYERTRAELVKIKLDITTQLQTRRNRDELPDWEWVTRAKNYMRKVDQRLLELKGARTTNTGDADVDKAIELLYQALDVLKGRAA